MNIFFNFFYSISFIFDLLRSFDYCVWFTDLFFVNAFSIFSPIPNFLNPKFVKYTWESKETKKIINNYYENTIEKFTIQTVDRILEVNNIFFEWPEDCELYDRNWLRFKFEGRFLRKKKKLFNCAFTDGTWDNTVEMLYKQKDQNFVPKKSFWKVCERKAFEQNCLFKLFKVDFSNKYGLFFKYPPFLKEDLVEIKHYSIKSDFVRVSSFPVFCDSFLINLNGKILINFDNYSLTYIKKNTTLLLTK